MGAELSTGKTIALELTVVLGAVFVLVILACLVFACYASHRAHKEDAEANRLVPGQWTEQGDFVSVKHIPSPEPRAKQMPPRHVVQPSSGGGFADRHESWEEGSLKQPERVYQSGKYSRRSRMNATPATSAVREAMKEGRMQSYLPPGAGREGRDPASLVSDRAVDREKTQRAERIPPEPSKGQQRGSTRRADPPAVSKANGRSRSKEKGGEFQHAFEARGKERQQDRAGRKEVDRSRRGADSKRNLKTHGSETSEKQGASQRTRRE